MPIVLSGVYLAKAQLGRVGVVDRAIPASEDVAMGCAATASTCRECVWFDAAPAGFDNEILSRFELDS